MRTRPRVIALALAWALSAAVGAAAEPALELSVDLSDVGKRLIHARVVVPAKPGPLTLYYPKWIPGTHGPMGPISEQAGLKTTAGGKTVAWKRDDVDPYTIHLTVPDGAESVTVAFDFVLQPGGSGFALGSALTAASPKLAVLNWNEVLMYPKGNGALDRPIRAKMTLPTGWKFGTSLATEGDARSSEVTFAAARLEELIDSPGNT
jgi:predicted metalloprotease with PDZ domain